jgi:hypothetical protein
VKIVLGWALLVLLATFVGSHIAIAYGLGRARGGRVALTAFFVAPIAPVWAWRAGMRGRAIAWLASVALYALGAAAA